MKIRDADRWMIQDAGGDGQDRNVRRAYPIAEILRRGKAGTRAALMGGRSFKPQEFGLSRGRARKAPSRASRFPENQGMVVPVYGRAKGSPPGSSARLGTGPGL
jgi:hypothetical protein